MDIWYQDNLVGGNDSFLIAASDFPDFGQAIKRKIERETMPSVPEPASVLGLLAIGAFGTGSALKSKKVAN